MTSPDHVPPDHFLRQFDRYPEGAERLAAMAAHCADLLNALGDEQAAHRETVRRVLDGLCAASPAAALACAVAFQLRDMESE